MTINVDPNAQHAVYSMSSGGRWAKEGGCPGSAEAIAMLPPQESGEAAEEGREAHTELERRLGDLNGEFVDPATMPVAEPDYSHPAAYSVAMMIAYVRQLPPGRMWVEKRVKLTPQIWGTADVRHWEDKTGILTIPDLKNGQRAVDADKEQTRLYGAAAMFTDNLPVKWFRAAIIQPYDWRPYVPRVKQHVESVESLYAFAQRVAAIPNGPKRFHAGEHCRDCPLFGRCNESIDMIAALGPLIAGLVQPHEIAPEMVAKFLACQKPLEDAFKKFKAHWQTAAIRAETAPDGMALVETRPHRFWISEEAARAKVYAAKGLAGLSPPTPAQAEEMGIDIAGMTDRPKASPALAFANDKRPRWKRQTAMDMFADVIAKIERK